MAHPTRPHLLSLRDWWALGEDQGGHVELQEGVRVVAPRPSPAHARTVLGLARQLADQLPDGVEVLVEVDVVVDPSTPATVRVPDLICRLATDDDSMITADQEILAVEVVSPGSRRTDRVTKSSEYADAGIPHYWIVHEDRTVTTLRLMAGGYEASVHVGDFATQLPWPLRITTSY